MAATIGFGHLLPPIEVESPLREGTPVQNFAQEVDELSKQGMIVFDSERNNNSHIFNYFLDKLLHRLDWYSAQENFQEKDKVISSFMGRTSLALERYSFQKLDRVLRETLDDNRDLVEMLLATKQAILIFRSDDRILGTAEDFKGNNELGSILMEVRNQYAILEGREDAKGIPQVPTVYQKVILTDHPDFPKPDGLTYGVLGTETNWEELVANFERHRFHVIERPRADSSPFQRISDAVRNWLSPTPSPGV